MHLRPAARALIRETHQSGERRGRLQAPNGGPLFLPSQLPHAQRASTTARTSCFRLKFRGSSGGSPRSNGVAPRVTLTRAGPIPLFISRSSAFFSSSSKDRIDETRVPPPCRL